MTNMAVFEEKRSTNDINNDTMCDYKVVACTCLNVIDHKVTRSKVVKLQKFFFQGRQNAGAKTKS